MKTTIEHIKIKSFLEYLNKIQPAKNQLAIVKMMKQEGVI